MCAGSSKAGDRSHLGRIDELEYDGPGDVFMISYDLLFSFVFVQVQGSCTGVLLVMILTKALPTLAVVLSSIMSF